ncbi:hypothetical protein [Demetria terragena]|uniref:hypothetical protein n=1 Tax=Demetria terragena TaxID=63959 RepID=UPI0003776034|nr:hypothetical protein [Demetria terragena]
MMRFTVGVLGTAVEVVLDRASISDELAEELYRGWQHCVTDRQPAEQVFVAIGHRAVVPEEYTWFVRALSPDGAAAQLSDVIVGTALATLIPPDADGPVRPVKVGIYAGGTVTSGGEGVLYGDLANLGGHRRSRVMDALCARHEYLSDTALALELSTGIIGGAAKPFTRFTHGRLSSRVEVPLAEAGFRPGTSALGRLVVFLDWLPEPGPASWEPLSLPEAAVRLAPAMPIFPALQHPLQELVTMLDRVSASVRVQFHDERDLPGLIEDVLSTQIEAPLVLPIDCAVDESTPPRRGAMRRVPLRDGVSDGTTMAMLRVDRQPLAVTGIAPHVWDLSRSWISAEDLTAALVERLGVPDGVDPGELVDDAVRQLVEQNVMVRLD